MTSPIAHRSRTPRLVLLALAAGQLAACSDSMARVTDAADKARSTTEEMAAESRIKARAREIAILPQADEVHKGSPVQIADRYQIREGPDGFMVYDTETHSIARIQNDLQIGKRLDQAEQAADALNYLDTKAKSGFQ